MSYCENSHKTAKENLILRKKIKELETKLETVEMEKQQLLTEVHYDVKGAHIKKKQSFANGFQEIKEHLENIIALTPGHLYWKDKNGTYLGCNNNLANNTGLKSPKDIIGMTDQDVASRLGWDKKVVEAFRKADEIVIKTGIPKLNIEEPPALNSKGEIIYLMSNKVPLYDANHKVIGVLGISLNITEQKKLLAKINSYCNWIGIEKDNDVKNYLENIIMHAPGHMYWKDKNGIYLGCNKNMAQAIGLSSPKEIIGWSDFDIAKKLNWPIDIAKRFFDKDLAVIKSGEGEFNIEEPPVKRADGETHILLTNKVPLNNSAGITIGVIGISTDITDRKKMEGELKKSKQKAEEASELKSQFIMNMQHDLRTPASGVAAMLEILAKNESDSGKKETLEEIADSSRKLLNILNAILEFDSIEKGTLPVLSEKFNLHDVIRDVEALEAPTATLKHLDIKTHIDDRLPKELIGDPFRIQRVLINLLSNAIKFTAKGYVEINEILWEHVDDRNVLVQIIVKDTGIGIPKDKQKVIFERFTRLDPSNKGIHEGLGLGLSMVKQFVEEMKGHIEIKSSPGQGTTFICTLPFKLPEPAKESESIKSTTEPISSEDNLEVQPSTSKILLIEDDRIAQLVGKSLLADEFHAQLDVATTGKEAVDLVKKSKPLYDLIFMDIGLPDGSGCDFTKQIHELSEETAKIPIIALTAHDNDKMKQDCQVCGMQDYLTKPLGVIKMDRIFQKWLHQTIDHDKKEKARKKDKIIDLELGAKLISGDIKKAKNTLKMLVDILPDYEKQLKENFRNNNFEEVKNIVHKLKGATTYCGSPRLKEASKTLEEKIRLTDKPKKDEIESLYKNLLSEINSLKKVFNKI